MILLALILTAGVHPAKVPSYATTVLPVCDADHNAWTVFDDTALKFKRCNGSTWSIVDLGGGATIPSGTIVMISTGTCATGFTEVSALNGKTLVGTIASNADVGTTGGNDSITPGGTVATGVFTGTAWTPPVISWPVAVPTLAGTAWTPPAISWPAGVPTFSGSALTATTFAIPTGSGSFKGTGTGGFSTVGGAAPGSTGATTSKSPGTPAGTVAWPAGVPTIGAYTPAGTISWPATKPTIAAYTPAGTIGTQAFTGNSFDNRSAYIKVIFCSKD